MVKPSREAEERPQISADSSLIVRRLEVSRLKANCYVVSCARSLATIVIDAGDECERILRALDEATDGDRSRLTQLVNTHGHADHTAAVSDLRAVLGPVPVVMHGADIELVAGSDSDARQYMRRPYTAVYPESLVDEGDTIHFGDCALRVIHTPGHSPGGLCLYGHGLVFTGDSLFQGGVGNWSFFKGNRDDLLRTVRERVLSLPPDTVAYPGHGPATTIGEERATNPYFRATGSELSSGS